MLIPLGLQWERIAGIYSPVGMNYTKLVEDCWLRINQTRCIRVFSVDFC